MITIKQTQEVGFDISVETILANPAIRRRQALPSRCVQEAVMVESRGVLTGNIPVADSSSLHATLCLY